MPLGVIFIVPNRELWTREENGDGIGIADMDMDSRRSILDLREFMDAVWCSYLLSPVKRVIIQPENRLERG